LLFYKLYVQLGGDENTYGEKLTARVSVRGYINSGQSLSKR
jgi:hypothetical protein